MYNQSKYNGIWHRYTCPVCNKNLHKEETIGPEWYYKCSDGHYEHYVAFWGDIVTINGKEFRVYGDGIGIKEIEEHLSGLE
jgi:hypothetical protein